MTSVPTATVALSTYMVVTQLTGEWLTLAWPPGLLRLLLLHSCSHLRLQIAHPGCDRAQDFDALAALIWP